jgi:hypothetical protein
VAFGGSPTREVTVRFVFVGFLPKRTAPRDAWLKAPDVEEIASVSECISPGPEGRFTHWKHNDLGFYDTEALANEVAAGDLDLYAYRLCPRAWRDADTAEFEVRAAPGDVPADYDFLGYDLATRLHSTFFECSPLSCNGLAAEIPVNRHCLLPDLESALAAAAALAPASTGREPGDLYLLEVHRKRRAAASKRSRSSRRARASAGSAPTPRAAPQTPPAMAASVSTSPPTSTTNVTSSSKGRSRKRAAR